MNPIPKIDGCRESTIQKRIIEKLMIMDWFVKPTHGNAYQCGLPDLFCCSQSYGIRWIEVKNPKKFAFTDAQLTVFTKFASKNVGIWVMTDEKQYDNLFGRPNWHTYLLSSRGITLGDSVKIIPKRGPEGEIQDAIIKELSQVGPLGDPTKNWFCVETYGSQYQSGFPDIFACHAVYGTRWIECKNAKHYQFTPAQMKFFPRFEAEGVGIWILTDALEIFKLFHKPNWREYLK